MTQGLLSDPTILIWPIPKLLEIVLGPSSDVRYANLVISLDGSYDPWTHKEEQHTPSLEAGKVSRPIEGSRQSESRGRNEMESIEMLREGSI